MSDPNAGQTNKLDDGGAQSTAATPEKKSVFTPKIIVGAVAVFAILGGILGYANLSHHRTNAASLPSAPQINNVPGAHPVSPQYAHQQRNVDEQNYAAGAQSGQSVFTFPEDDQATSQSATEGASNGDTPPPPPPIDVQPSTPAGNVAAQSQPQQAQQAVASNTNQTNQYSEQLRNLLGQEIPNQNSEKPAIGLQFTAARDLSFGSNLGAKQFASQGLQGTPGTPGQSVSQTSTNDSLAPAVGTLLPARMINGLNSDAPGPAFALITSGPLAGARVIGSFQTAREGLTLRFTTMAIPNADGTTTQVDIQADAISEQGDEVPANVNDHFLANAAVTFLAGFGQDMGNILQESGATTTTTGSGLAITSNPSLTVGQELGAAAGGAVGAVGEQFQQVFGNRPPTIKIPPGTSFTLAFTGKNVANSQTAEALQNIRPTVGGLNTNSGSDLAGSVVAPSNYSGQFNSTATGP